MSGPFAPVNVDLNVKAGEVDAPRVGSLCKDTLPSGKNREGRGVFKQATGWWVEYTKNASVAGCQIFPIPPLPEGNHSRGKCVTRVLMPPRARVKWFPWCPLIFFKYVISLQIAQHVTKMTQDIESYVNFPGKKVKANCFFTWLFKNYFTFRANSNVYSLCM